MEKMTKLELREQFSCRTNLEYKPNDRSFEHVSGKSETIPDQSMSVREIIKKFTQGTLPDIGKSIYYELDAGSEDFDEYDVTESPDFDLTDVENYRMNIEKIIEKNTENISTVRNDDNKDEEKEEKSDSEIE